MVKNTKGKISEKWGSLKTKLNQKSKKTKASETVKSAGQTQKAKLGKISISKIGKADSIGVKLYGAFLIPILLMILLGILIYGKVSNALIDNFKDSTVKTFEAKSEYLDNILAVVKEKATQLIVNPDIATYYGTKMSNADATKTYNNLIKTVASTYGAASDVKGYYIFGGQGKPIESTTAVGVDYLNGFESSEEGKTYTAEGDSFKWTGYHNFIDESVGTPADGYAIALTLSSFKPKTYIICDIRADRIKDIVNSVDLGEGSVVGFITKDGRETLSEGAETVTAGEAIHSLSCYAKALESENQSGFIENVDWNGKDYCFVYAKVEESESMICGFVPTAKVVGAANAIGLMIIFFVIIAVIIGIITATVITVGIGKTIGSINKGLAKAAGGDLTVVFKTKRRDEFKTLTDSINTMMQNTHQLIEEANLTSGKVKNSSVMLTNKMNEMTTVTNEISGSFSEVEKGCVQQAEDIEKCAQFINHFAEEITKVSDGVADIKSTADNTEESVKHGVSIVGELDNKMRATADITGNVIEGIGELEALTHSVDEIVGFINGLSTQTNLLSLNASIEAARAGAAGRGFSVVAEEIRKLADQTMSAGNNIQELIQNIQNKTQDSVELARQAGDIVSSQMSALEDTRTVFSDITKKVSSLSDNFAQTLEKIEVMNGIKHETMERIESIAAISEESSAVVTEVTTSSNAQIETMNWLAKESEALTQGIVSLEKAISKFHIADESK